MFDWSMKPPPEKYNFYCGSCGCKYLTKPEATRSACSSNCIACGSSRIYATEWAEDKEDE
jgi:hypothetical protein